MKNMKKSFSLFLAMLLLLLPVLSLADTAPELNFLEAFDLTDKNVLRVTLDEEGSDITLHPTCVLTNVQIEELTFFEDTLSAQEIFFITRLTPDDLLCLRAYLYDAVPRFRVTFTDENGLTTALYILDSGEDGSLFFLPDGEIF